MENTGMIMDAVSNQELNDKKEALDTAISNNKITIPQFKRQRTLVKENKEPGRNDKCPCGSGKKYKNCCMLKEDNPYIQKYKEV